MKNKRSDKFNSILELLAQGKTNKEIADKMNTNFKHIEYKMSEKKKKLNNISGDLN